MPTRKSVIFSLPPRSALRSVVERSHGLRGWHSRGALHWLATPSPTRKQIAQQDLLKTRSADDERAASEGRERLVRLLERTKAEYGRYTAGGQKEPPVLDILVISGGGDWGGLGRCFSKGGRRSLPSTHSPSPSSTLSPTGVSTGTLIAPFAFLGDEQSIDRIVNLYRKSQIDWVKQRGKTLSNPRLRTPDVRPGVKASEGGAGS